MSGAATRCELVVDHVECLLSEPSKVVEHPVQDLRRVSFPVLDFAKVNRLVNCIRSGWCLICCRSPGRALSVRVKFFQSVASREERF
jgi:hypothetical protein